MKYIVAIAVFIAVLTGCSVPVPDAPDSALGALATLSVKDPAPQDGYSRDKFPHWIDMGGCDTRSHILESQAREMTRDAQGCVDEIAITDPYTGDWTVGRANIDIDHVVSLSNAWKTGAASLSLAQRTQLANDPTNLLAVDKRLNRQKSDKDAASWLPPLEEAWCDYAARQVTVKQRYNLWVTQAEHDALETILATCPRQKLIP